MSPEADLAQTVDGTGGMRNAAAPTPSVFPPPEAMRPTIVGRGWVVAAGHPLVAQVMARVLEEGGNAVDAGVAGTLASTVVQADMCNLGGIAPLLARPAGSDRVWQVAGVGPWGQAATLEAFRARHGDDIPLGAPAGVVPGGFAALCEALARWGSWRFRDVAAPAARLAAEGFPLDRRGAEALAILGRGFARWESSRRIYWPEGRPPRPGETLVQADLGRTLLALAAEDRGPDRLAGIKAARRAFYEGEIAARLVAANREGGGFLSREDLARHRADVSAAPSVSYRGHRVHAAGPFSQGPVLLQALALLGRHTLGRLGRGGAEHLHLVAEALRLAFADRDRSYHDPAERPEATEAILSPEHLEALGRTLDPGRAGWQGAEEARGRARFDTTYVAAADAAGNVLSCMPSDTLDGAPVVEGLGFFVSPRGVQSRLDPAHPAAIAPGRRPRITPAPAIVVGPSGGAYALGCPGGDVIVQAMLQAVVNLHDFALSPQEAVEAPRVATFSFPGSFFPNPCFPGRLDVEGRVPQAVRDDLAARGHRVHLWPDWEFDAGAVMLAGRMPLSPDGPPVLAAAADPRRSAYALGG
ncbi:gamma-glutamyltransferase family protein [Rubellimicrobium sp. CFH 75288]|uniref:gamma-glutamyltransferase family protein n=1 Tax=Rubellimicrobium sp. CFH 75288 TaxID=2697034 RepID=UPI001412E1AC|nr:gamma-glutamyltransferase [Rubellimicrobium sp. CFH 75288]NAZ37357.1 gamma-glutamyltransferase family protein [Rubellimicrobium sp. CFH 75288]